jgi:hypothetical protein
MSAMADYDLWLREHGLADSDDNRAAYLAERERERLHPVVIAAPSYAETEARLRDDPIVRAMAEGVRSMDRDELAHPDGGGPRQEFMTAANDEYRKRGGKDGGHMGAIANAILSLLDDPHPADQLAERAMDVIDRAVAEGELPG